MPTLRDAIHWMDGTDDQSNISLSPELQKNLRGPSIFEMALDALKKLVTAIRSRVEDNLE